MPARERSLSPIHSHRHNPDSCLLFAFPFSSSSSFVRREIHGMTGTQPNAKSVNDVTGAPPNTNPARSDQG
ncbi:hypothetical protein CCMA1212_008075 [Trichoderma ghanense]|uniref:Uncharacterized protein n=1 Tax=Trichoderma ghanense TaxID=65468 RepID=A0ABY2GV60_9HYPO